MKRLTNEIPNQFVKTTVLWFFLIMVVLNAAIWALSYYHYQEEKARTTTRLVEVMSHMLYYESIESTIAFATHYEHTQNISIRLTDANYVVIYASSREFTENKTYLVQNNQEILGYLSVDYEYAFFGQRFNQVFWVFHLFSLGLFLFLTYTFLNKAKQLNLAIKEDLSNIPLNHVDYHFEEFSELKTKMQSYMQIENDYKAHLRNHVLTFAHDFKTPLTIIRLTLESKRKGLLESDEAFLCTIEDELKTMESILPKLMTTKVDQMVAKHDLSQLIYARLDALRDVFASKNINIQISLYPFEFWYSEEEIKRVFDHLLFNAFYYSLENSTIHVSVNPVEQTLSIKDEGIGMDEETIKRVLKGNYRHEHAMNMHKSGSGKGLMIVNNILTKNGYSLSITQNATKGITATITFKSSNTT